LPSEPATVAAPGSPARRESRWLHPALPLAASLAALALALSAWLNGAQSRGRLDAMRAERDQLELQVATLEAELDATGKRLDQLTSAVRAVTFPGRNPIVLAGVGTTPRASGAAFYHPVAGEAIFYAYGLPALTSERTYQLWYILASGPVSAGIFRVDERGEATVTVEEVAEPASIVAWAVTVEPAGGVAQPTGPMVVKSG
jgi:hypothetical protein